MSDRNFVYVEITAWSECFMGRTLLGYNRGEVARVPPDVARRWVEELGTAKFITAAQVAEHARDQAARQEHARAALEGRELTPVRLRETVVDLKANADEVVFVPPERAAELLRDGRAISA